MADLSPELVAELRTLPPDANPQMFGALAARADRLQPGAVAALTKAWSNDIPPDAAPEVVARLVDSRLAEPTYRGFLRAEDTTATQQGGQGSVPTATPQGSLESIAAAWRARHQTHGLHRLQDQGEIDQAHREAMERTRGAIGHFQAPAGRTIGELAAARHQADQQARQQNPLTSGWGLTGVSQGRSQHRPVKG